MFDSSSQYPKSINSCCWLFHVEALKCYYKLMSNSDIKVAACGALAVSVAVFSCLSCSHFYHIWV